ncbi:MFS transporter [Methylobacterium sp. 1030]|uniref:MFS transporter n=1 Tax=Methylobacterium sp. 1030 TaxID=3156404 RepID=UPI003397722C
MAISSRGRPIGRSKKPSARLDAEADRPRGDQTEETHADSARGAARPPDGDRVDRLPVVVLALIFVVYTLAAADRANIGIVLPSLKREFAMTNTEAGAVVSLFFVGYAAMHIPAGIIVRRFGPRRIFPIFMILTSTFTGSLGLVGSVLALKLNRLALGVAESPLPISMLTTMNRWFPPQEKGSAVGVYLVAAKFVRC